MEGEGAVGTLQAHTNLAGRLNSLQLVGAGCGAAAVGAAGGEQGCQAGEGGACEDGAAVNHCGHGSSFAS